MIGSKKKTKKGNVLKEIADNFEQLTSNPERFLKPQPEQIEAIEQLIQQTYSVSISGDVANKKDLLQELVLEQMDEEQIWQQLEMRNELVFQQLLEQTAQMTAIREQHLGIELDEGEEQEEDLDVEAENGEIDAEESDEDPESDASFDEGLSAKNKSQPQKEKGNKRLRNSIVDDTFFKLQEMNEFLEQEDAKEMRRMNNKRGGEQAEEIDHFAEDFGLGEDEEDDDGNVNYADFFEMDEELERKSQKLNKGKTKDFFNEDESDKEEKEDDEDEENQEDLEEAEGSEEEHDPEKNQDEAASEIDESEFVSKSGIEPASGSDSDSDKEGSEEEEDNHKVADPPSQSSNELREARLFQRIRDYEDVVLGEKPWQLKGEVQAANRPQNSLLEEILDFDSTTRPTAPITEEDNRSIEDIIKQRIRDKAWDDVVRTVRPVNTPQEYRKQLILDQEKSKQSLSQIYEAQYQRELDKLDPNRDAEDNSGPEPKEHQEIKKAMRSLFLKLDALSNFHFTPKPVAPEARIVTNTPVVHMEEVAPVAVSDANLLAPEEVFQGPKTAPLGKSERSRTDKNRERRKKKQKQRAIHTALEHRDLQRAKEGKVPTKKEADAKLLKTITKSRNVQKITASSNDQGALKNSKAFFNKLQDTTAATASNKRPKKDVTKANAKKLKL